MPRRAPLQGRVHRGPAAAGLSDALPLQSDPECGTRFFDPEPSELAAVVVSRRPRRHRRWRCPSRHRESAPARKDHVPHPRSTMTSEAPALGAAGQSVNAPSTGHRTCWQKARTWRQATRRSGDVSEARVPYPRSVCRGMHPTVPLPPDHDALAPKYGARVTAAAANRGGSAPPGARGSGRG